MLKSREDENNYSRPQAYDQSARVTTWAGIYMFQTSKCLNLQRKQLALTWTSLIRDGTQQY